MEGLDSYYVVVCWVVVFCREVICLFSISLLLTLAFQANFVAGKLVTSQTKQQAFCQYSRSHNYEIMVLNPSCDLDKLIRPKSTNTPCKLIMNINI